MQKVVAISQQKGGAGKSTLAAHLAVCLAQKGYRVSVLDIDPQESLTTWYKTRETFAGRKKAEINFATLTSIWGLRIEIERNKKDNDIVIIDCPPHTKSEAKVAVKESDLALIPMQPSPADLWATTSTLELSLRENPNSFVVLNRVIYNTKIAKQFMEDLPRSHVLCTVGNRVGFVSAMAEGKCITETEPSSRGSQEISEMADIVIEKLKTIPKKKKKKIKKPELEDAGFLD